MEVTWSFAEIAMAVRSDHSYKLFSMKPEELKIISNGASKAPFVPRSTDSFEHV